MFRKLTSSLGFGSTEPPKSVVVQYLKSSYQIDFEPGDSELEIDPKKGPTVGFLRRKVAEILTPILIPSKSKPGHGSAKIIDPARFTLVFSGHKLTDDSTPLGEAGLQTNSKILVLAHIEELKPQGNGEPEQSGQEPKRKRNRSKKVKTKSASTTPSASVNVPPIPLTPRQKIEKVFLETEKDLRPKIDQYIAHVPTDPAEKEEKHRVYSELVLQKMFSLDEIDVSADPELRQYRKSVINKLHQYHSNLDNAFKGLPIETDKDTE